MRYLMGVLVLLTTGCGTTQGDIDRVANTPTPKLCQMYVEANPNWYLLDTISSELNKRNEDCEEYVLADMRRTKINNSNSVKVNTGSGSGGFKPYCPPSKYPIYGCQ